MKFQATIAFTESDFYSLQEIGNFIRGLCEMSEVQPDVSLSCGTLGYIVAPAASAADNFVEAIKKRMADAERAEADDVGEEDLHVDTADFQRRMLYVLQHAPASEIRALDVLLSRAAEGGAA